MASLWPSIIFPQILRIPCDAHHLGCRPAGWTVRLLVCQSGHVPHNAIQLSRSNPFCTTSTKTMCRPGLTHPAHECQIDSHNIDWFANIDAAETRLFVSALPPMPTTTTYCPLMLWPTLHRSSESKQGCRIINCIQPARSSLTTALWVGRATKAH